jgi:hypothetical protein
MLFRPVNFSAELVLVEGKFAPAHLALEGI